jgi:hypothetical protein
MIKEPMLIVIMIYKGNSLPSDYNLFQIVRQNIGGRKVKDVCEA